MVRLGTGIFCDWIENERVIGFLSFFLARSALFFVCSVADLFVVAVA